MLKDMGSDNITIGFLMDWVVNSYHMTFLDEMAKTAEKMKVNLLCFECGSLNSHRPYEKYRNMLYKIISPRRIDGLIILSGAISRYTAYPVFKEFCDQFKKIPTVSIAYEIKGIPSILIDNSSGLREMMIHLIKKHHYHRFAFIKGMEENQDALYRFHTFTEILAEFSLPLDKKLILPGDFTIDAGSRAARRLLKEKRGQFDVIVAANDSMALGAMDVLMEEGIKIPEDIAVVGFDNLDTGRYALPALTTVRQPIPEQCEEAIRTVMEIIRGQEVEQRTLIPTEMVIRNSCGCSWIPTENKLSELFLFSSLGNETEDVRGLFRKQTTLLMDRLFPDSIYLLLEEMADAFIFSRQKQDTGPFIRALSNFIAREEWSGLEISNLKEVIKHVRSYFKTRLKTPEELLFLETLCLESLDLIGQVALSREKSRDMRLIYESIEINMLREEVLMAPDREGLMDILASRLPELSIISCYIALFQTPWEELPRTARLLLGYSLGQQVNTGEEGIEFETQDLVPRDIFPTDRRFTMLVKALKDRGYVIFEMKSAKNNILSVIGDLISTNLEGILLFQELEKQKDALNLSLDKMKWSMIDFINTIAMTLETRDPYTAGHQRQVSDLARTIAATMKVPREMIESIRMAGLIHDLGKIYVPVQLLNKPGRLKENEMNLIRKHAKIGYDILKNIQFPWPLAEIVYQHHEHYDGKGYPRGLKGEEILLEARILAVADAVEAITANRPYRPALGIETALDEIVQQRGSHFDPQVVDACIRVFYEQDYKFKENKR